MKKTLLTILCIVCAMTTMAQTITIEAETMTLSGPYAGKVTSPFNGIALYGNGDCGTTQTTFSQGNGVYTIKVTGASNNSSAAGVSLYIAGQKVEAFTFSGTAATTKTSQKKLYFDSKTVEVKLLLETDNGSNDTYVDKVEFTMDKPLVERPAPVLPTQSVAESGVYRNILKEAGYSDAEINGKLQSLWKTYFEGDAETERLYYETGDDEAYILDVNNNDIRSEGMSYGMMICVQMDKQKEFNRLWKWVKNHMQFQEGPLKGFISWQINTDGSNASKQSAPDGDEYIATALMFAAGRWGSGTGIYNYWKEANFILQQMLSKDHFVNSSTVNMFNRAERQIVFVPYASSAKHTDPSYHMPAFYTLWSQWADRNRSFWKSVAEKSREMYPKFAHATTGLMPDYANFDGTPTGSGHQEFRYDAWRCVMHMATDYMWHHGSKAEYELTDRLLKFFYNEGVSAYGSEYSLIGNKLNKDHSAGLVGCNAVGAMISDNKFAWDFVDDFYEMTPTTGRYRYYDGTLYMLSYLFASGNFRMYRPAEVLQVALDEQYVYDKGYILVNDFEGEAAATTDYFMRASDSSTGKAVWTTDPASASNHALHVNPGNYDEFLWYAYTLPEGHVLSKDYASLEFDVYYNPNGDNNNQELRVYLDDFSTIYYKQSTGAKANQGRWEHVTVPLTGNKCGNEFVIGLGVRTRAADYYIDNVKLKYEGNDIPSGVIKIVNTEVGKASGACYNLMGQRVADGARGIVVQHGKKIISK